MHRNYVSLVLLIPQCCIQCGPLKRPARENVHVNVEVQQESSSNPTRSLTVTRSQCAIYAKELQLRSGVDASGPAAAHLCHKLGLRPIRAPDLGGEQVRSCAAKLRSFKQAPGASGPPLALQWQFRDHMSWRAWQPLRRGRAAEKATELAQVRAGAAGQRAIARSVPRPRAERSCYGTLARFSGWVGLETQASSR